MKDFILTYRRFFLTVLVLGILIILLWMLCNSASETTKKLKEKNLRHQTIPVAETVEAVEAETATEEAATEEPATEEEAADDDEAEK